MQKTEMTSAISDMLTTIQNLVQKCCHTYNISQTKTYNVIKKINVENEEKDCEKTCGKYSLTRNALCQKCWLTQRKILPATNCE
jgi:hypothetical protein